MDRHVKWLRRRVIASIATQTAETFAVVAVVCFAILQWRTDEGPLSSLFASVVIAQLISLARVGHAMRNNPLNYVFMRKYVDRPFSYSVARFQGDEEAHPSAAQLPGFAPVATIRDADADPEPVFDVYHDPSRLVAASVSRASGSISLISSLTNDRVLVTDARAMPPHERLVMNLAPDDSIASIITTHRKALSNRTDVIELASSAHQVVMDSLTIEYQSYQSIGPALSPFLDLDPQNRSPLRLTTRVKPEELATLPVRLGPDLPGATAPMAHPAPTPVASAQVVAPVTAPEIMAPDIVAPDVAAAAGVTIPHVVAPEIITAPAARPTPVSPVVVEAPAPPVPPVSPVVVEAPAPPVPPVSPLVVEAPVPPVSPVVVEASAPPVSPVVVEAPAPPVPPVSPVVVEAPAPPVPPVSPVAMQAPTASTKPVPPVLPVLVEASAPQLAPTLDPPEATPAAADQAKTDPAILAEMALLATVDETTDTARIAPELARAEEIGFKSGAIIDIATRREFADPVRLTLESEGVAAPLEIADPVFVTLEPDADDIDEPHPITAEVPMVVIDGALGSPTLQQAIHEPAIHEPMAQPVLAPVEPVVEPVAEPIRPAAAMSIPPVQTTAPTFAPLPQFAAKAPAPPATLAEAVVAAPDTAAALTDPTVAAAEMAARKVAALAAVSIPGSMDPASAGALAQPPSDEEQVPDLATALGFSDVARSSRPRLSQALRANSTAGASVPAPKRSRRKTR